MNINKSKSHKTSTTNFTEALEGFLDGLLRACKAYNKNENDNDDCISNDPELEKIITRINNNTLFNQNDELSKLTDISLANDELTSKLVADNSKLTEFANKAFNLNLKSAAELSEENKNNTSYVEPKENIVNDTLQYKFSKFPIDGITDYYQTTLPIIHTEKVDTEITMHDIKPNSLVFFNNKFYWFKNYYNDDLMRGEFFELSPKYFSYFTSDDIPLNSSENLSYAIASITTLPVYLNEYIRLEFNSQILTSIYDLPSSIICLDELENAIVFNIEIYDSCGGSLLNRNIQYTINNKIYTGKIMSIEYSTIVSKSGRCIKTYKAANTIINKHINLLDLENIIKFNPKLITPYNRIKNMYIIKPSYSRFFKN